MPLYAHHPVPAALPFYRFDDAIGSAGGHAQSAAGLEDCLVMRAVDLGFACCMRVPGNLSQMSALDAHGMEAVVSVFVLIVIDRGLRLAGDVLQQSAAEVDVQELRAIADRQNRLAGFHRVIE